MITSFIFFINLLFFPISSNGQTFEGSITYIKETITDTTYCKYYIKGNKIRMDELNKNKKLIKYTVVDIENNNVNVVNPSKRVYMPLDQEPYTPNRSDNKFEILKTGNSRIINGYTCYQWRVINQTNNTEIDFWVTNKSFKFYDEYLRVINRRDKTPYYYLQIPGADGYVPMLSIERSLLREKRVRFEVINVQQTKLSSSIFEIPKDFSKF